MLIKPILENIKNARANLEFLPTGFSGLDTDLDGGFIRKELIVIGGFTGIGKSYIAGQIMTNIARSGFKTAYFSLEISNEMVVSRMIGQQADLKSIKIMTGNLTNEENTRKLQAEGMLEGYSSYMDFHDDKYVLSDIENTIKNSDYEFVIIDFIQNIMIPNMDEYSRLSYISLQLQKLAKEKNCCILLLSQLSNSVAKNIENTQLEYKGSGAIATVCDIGFFITREIDRSLGIDRMELAVRKNRRGLSGGKYNLHFTGEGGFIK